MFSHNDLSQGGQGCFDIDECTISEGVSRHWCCPLGKNSCCQFLIFLIFQINYCGQNTNCNNWPGTFECNEDDCKEGYTNWRANHGAKMINSWCKKLPVHGARIMILWCKNNQFMVQE